MNINLQSLQGWLKVYFIYLLIAVGLDVIFIGQGLMYSFGLFWISTSLLGFGFHIFTAWALTQTGQPWVRILHIALNGITAALLMASIAGLPTVPFLGGITLAPLSGVIYLILPYDLIQPMQLIFLGISATLAAAWTAYWVMSARVRDVYLTPVPSAGTAPDASLDIASDTAPDAPQKAAPPQDGYITEEDAARGQAHQSAQAPRPPTADGPVQPGMNPVLKGCLIALGLLLVAGLIFVVLIITTLESWYNALFG